MTRGHAARDDPETHAYITPHMEAWNDLTVVHRDVSIAIDGVGFTAIGRLQLLRLLQDRVRSVGIEPHFESPLSSLDTFADADLIIGADGVNSLVRNSHAARFGSTLSHGSNKFIWYGVETHATLADLPRNRPGALTVHHYRYAPDRNVSVEVMRRLGSALASPDGRGRYPRLLRRCSRRN
jgi:2-polyprenyl-6-methoxyphenol hydroxylase-like FAD-dependent oxidoreductase